MTSDSQKTGTRQKSGTPQKSGASEKSSAPRKTGEDGKAGKQAQIEVWTGYTHYLLAADGLLRLTDAFCRKRLEEPASEKVSAVIAAAHAALQGVNDQLVKGIENMKEGKDPEYTFEPSPIPDWPGDAGDTSVFAGAWETIKAVLEKMMDAAAPSSAMGLALAGVINSGDEIIKSLEKAFG